MHVQHYGQGAFPAGSAKQESQYKAHILARTEDAIILFPQQKRTTRINKTSQFVRYLAGYSWKPELTARWQKIGFECFGNQVIIYSGAFTVRYAEGQRGARRIREHEDRIVCIEVIQVGPIRQDAKGSCGVILGMSME